MVELSFQSKSTHLPSPLAGEGRGRGNAGSQRGFSLIGIMTGLLISTLAALSALSLYRTLVARSVESGQRANQDGHLAAGTLGAQMELQGAGFGIGTLTAPAAANTDFIVLANAAVDAGGALSGSAQTIGTGAQAGGNAIVWSANPTLASIECNALIASNGGLKLLRATCSAATQWSSLSWQTASELIPAGGVTTSGAMLRAERSSCWPFGQAGASMQAIKVTLWDDASAWKSSVCLPNVKAPAT